MANPYGTLRQDIGGDYDRPAPRRWYSVVPFRPCRPPTPDWIIDWPLEVLSKTKSYLLQFSACRDVETLLQDARNGLIPGLTLPTTPPIDTGPSANPPAPSTVANPSGNRIWVGRVRGAGVTPGLPNRHLAVSPQYDGPATITHISLVSSLTNGGGAQPRDTWVLGVGNAGNSKVDTTPNDPDVAVGGFPIFDFTQASDQQNEQIPTTPGYLPGAGNFPEEGSPNWYHIPCRIPISLSPFKLWLLMNTYSVNASAVTVVVTIEQGTQTQGGVVLSQYNMPPNWGKYWIG